MLCNDFIVNFLNIMSFPCKRLRDDITKLQIQIVLNNPIIYNSIDYFLSIKAEYQRKWYLVEKNLSRDTYDINKTYGYQQFYKFINKNMLFTNDELEWIEDAIHEIMTN